MLTPQPPQVTQISSLTQVSYEEDDEEEEDEGGNEEEEYGLENMLHA